MKKFVILGQGVSEKKNHCSSKCTCSENLLTKTDLKIAKINE